MENHVSAHGRVLRILLIATVALGGMFLPTWAVTANGCPSTSYFGMVTSTADSLDPGTLRGEIECGTSSFVYFSHELGGSTVTLTMGEINISRAVTVYNSGFDPVTLDAGYSSRIFNISGLISVQLSGMILTGGQDGYATPTKAGLAQGGAIYNDQGTVMLSYMTFMDNHTIANQSEGGAIYNNNGSMLVQNSTFYNNSSTSYWSRGGAIYNNNGDLYVQNSTFTNNSAEGNTNGYGGAIYNGHNLFLDSDTFYANSVSDSGGNIYNLTSFASEVTNSILAGSSTSGGNCAGSAFTSISTSMSDDSTCGAGFAVHTLAELSLGSLGFYGGQTKTIPLLENSVAIDAGGSEPCSLIKDQRDVFRPVGTACDIGAFEYDEPVPTVVYANSFPLNGTIFPSGISSATIVFNKAMATGGGIFPTGTIGGNGADAPWNYLLVEAGANGVIDTHSCGDIISVSVGAIPLGNGDNIIPMDSIDYDEGTFTATLYFNGGLPLPNGTYKLFICGTTSITDTYGLELNYGLYDSTIAFQIGAESVTAPATGFAPNRVSPLSLQTTEYANLGDLWIEIPSLGVREPIVGVPLQDGTWDVSWLGSDIGWLNGSAFPTWAGNSVLTGHVYDAFGQPGPFVGINRLWYGSQIIVHAWGGQYIYEVRSIMQVSPNNTTAMLKHQELPWLTLVTCRGYNVVTDSYRFRVLVRAVLVDEK